jgi:hypothetical protein
MKSIRQEHVKEEKKKHIVHNIIPHLKSLASMVWAVRFVMMRDMHKAMVTDILRAVEVKVALIDTVLTMKEL